MTYIIRATITFNLSGNYNISINTTNTHNGFTGHHSRPVGFRQLNKYWPTNCFCGIDGMLCWQRLWWTTVFFVILPLFRPLQRSHFNTVKWPLYENKAFSYQSNKLPTFKISRSNKIQSRFKSVLIANTLHNLNKSNFVITNQYAAVHKSVGLYWNESI